MPDGSVTPWPDHKGLQKTDFNNFARRKLRGYTIRVRDRITNDTRYVTIAMGGIEGFMGFTGQAGQGGAHGGLGQRAHSGISTPSARRRSTFHRAW